MTALTLDSTKVRAPVWLSASAGFGVLWNLYGLLQFAGSFTQTVDSLMAVGMSPAQAQLYLSLPAWISAAFGIGVGAGLVGSVALLLGRRMARPTFAVSLAGYLLLFAGDTYYGVFAAMPAQLLLLLIVVLIAVTLFWVSSRAAKLGLLR